MPAAAPEGGSKPSCDCRVERRPRSRRAKHDMPIRRQAHGVTGQLLRAGRTEAKIIGCHASMLQRRHGGAMSLEAQSLGDIGHATDWSFDQSIDGRLIAGVWPLWFRLSRVAAHRIGLATHSTREVGAGCRRVV